MDLRKLFLTKNECYIVGAKMTPKGIMWHSTGANNPNLRRYVGPDDGSLGVNSYGNHWNTYRPGGIRVCVHAFIGKLKNGAVATYQTLPWNMRGWHASGSANNNYIGFEICEDGLNDRSYFDKVYKEAVELTAYLCKLYNLDPNGKNVIICHQDGYKLGIASNHGDVYHWFNKFGKTMADVRKDVAKAIGSVKEETPKQDTTELYRVCKSWADAKSQIGAYKILDNAKAKADENPGYSVYDSAGKCIYTKTTTPENKSFTVRVKIKNLNIRKGPGYKTYARVGYCPVGTYTIVETKVAEGYTWGRLKSGIGWIALEYTERV